MEKSTTDKIAEPIDIRRDILAFYLNEEAYINRAGYSDRLYGRNVWARLRRIVKVAYVQLRALLGFDKEASIKDIKGDIWVFYNTKNQYDSLAFMRQYFPRAVWLTNNRHVRKFDRYYSYLIPLWGNLPWRHLPRYFGTFYRAYRENRRHFSRMFHFFFAAAGQYERYSQLIKQVRPRIIVMSNDHTVHFRAMVHAAKRHGVLTVFFQHASVMNDFPPMRFDHACLEGQDTLDKYLAIGGGPVTYHLVGMPKFDCYFNKINQATTVKTLGIPYGMIIPIEQVAELVAYIDRECRGLTIIVRRHPADRRSFDLPQLTGQNKLVVSEPLTQSAFDFLSSTDMIISGTSSIHLEAVLMNIVSLYYEPTNDEKGRDLYGYVANGLIDQVKTLPEVVEYVRANQLVKQSFRHRAKHYYAPLGTDYDGQSGELAATVLKKILNGTIQTVS